MNKEEKAYLESLTATFKACAQRFEVMSKPPVIFGADCGRCGKGTIHESHIVGHSASSSEPLKTCLACGLTTFRDEREE